MKHSIAMLLISVLGIAGILYTTIINADVSDIKTCIVVGVNVMKNILKHMVHF